PKSPGGKLCRNLVTEIESKSAAITTEHVWNAPTPKITVHYRNVNAVYFRAVAYDWEVFLEKRHNRPGSLNEKEQKEVLAKRPVLEWSEKLVATEDYKERTARLDDQDKLKPGIYFIIASHDPCFGE